MTKCKRGGYCDPYMDANGIWRCSKCGERIKQYNNRTEDIDFPDDEEPQDEEEIEF